jgi:hypothetical protein
MNQPVVHAPLETQSEIPSNPVDGESIDPIDAETEEKKQNDGEVIIRCESLKGRIPAWFQILKNCSAF